MNVSRYVSAVAFLFFAAGWMLLNALWSTHAHPVTVLAVTVDRLVDPSGALSLDDVRRKAAAQFRPVESSSQAQAGAEWYRIVPPPEPGTPLVLSLAGAPDQADLYFRRIDGSYGVVPFGETQPYNERRFPSPFVATAITSAMRTASPLYVRTVGTQSVYGHFQPVQLQTLPDYDAFLLAKTGGTLAFVGFFAAMGLVSAFLGLYLRERMFALHAALMAAAIVWDLTEKYLAWQFLWPFASISFPTAESLTFSAYLFVLLLFARSFLSLDKTLPVLDRALWVILALNVLTAFFAQPSVGGPALAAIHLLQLAPFVLLPVAGAIRWRSGFLQARFFVLGFAGLFVVFLTAVLFGNAPLSPWAIDTGVACESLLFQFAVADRMLSLMRERDYAQRASIAAKEQLAQSQQESIDRLETYNEAFSRFVPREFLTQLGHEDVITVRLGDSVAEVMTVLFADIRGFTKLAETLSPSETFAFINDYLSHAGPVIRAHGGFIDKYIGDGMLALFPDSADHALDAAIELHQTVRRLNESRARLLQVPIAIGVGLHRGNVMLGTIGEEKRYETTVIADAVNIASRLEGLTKEFGANIVASAEVVGALVNRPAFRLRPFFPVHVRGASRAVEVFEVCDADDPELLLQKVATLEVFESASRAYVSGDFETSKHLFEEVTRRSEKDLPAAYFLQQATRLIEHRLS